MALSRSRAVAVIVLIGALALGVGSSVVLAHHAADALVPVSVFTVVDGAVLISRGGAEFASAREGDVLGAGDTIRTAAGASAEITYVDGSSTRLAANTEIIVMRLRAADDRAAQVLGRAWHVVTKLFNDGSRYETRGPSSTASVRG
ncbi:MAG TPA: FecR domain-containing protein [Candidatus Limnocylindria bacterium]